MRSYKKPVLSNASTKGFASKEFSCVFVSGLGGSKLVLQNKLPRKLEGFKHN